jgi:hypothetical protein
MKILQKFPSLSMTPRKNKLERLFVAFIFSQVEHVFERQQLNRVKQLT